MATGKASVADVTVLTFSTKRLMESDLVQETEKFKYKFVVPADLPLQPTEVIGVGSFSTVCRAVVNVTGVPRSSFAIKKLENALSPYTDELLQTGRAKKSTAQTKQTILTNMTQVAREVCILQSICHPFLLRANRVWVHGHDLYLASQLLKADLGAVLDRNRRTNSYLSLKHIELITFETDAFAKQLKNEDQSGSPLQPTSTLNLFIDGSTQ